MKNKGMRMRPLVLISALCVFAIGTSTLQMLIILHLVEYTDCFLWLIKNDVVNKGFDKLVFECATELRIFQETNSSVYVFCKIFY